jgi:hypothetical protein
MNFIQAKNKRLYPATRFVSIGPEIVRDDEAVVDVEIEGGGTVVFYAHRISEFLRQPVAALAAAPETYIVRIDETVPGGFWRTEVIGWSFARDGRTYPVTAEGLNDGEDTYHYVQTPDGRVSQPESGSWSSVEMLLRDLAEYAKIAAA